jgi:choline monooxygenase
MTTSATLKEIIDSYDQQASLERASTIPSQWYTDHRIIDLERQTVFARSWQIVGRVDQVSGPGDYLTNDVAGEPIICIRGNDHVLRAFFNVCRHHAAAVLTEPDGRVLNLRCPYHGWTYSLDGELIGTPDFSGVCDFDKKTNGLVPVEVGEWQNWIFIKLVRGDPSLSEFLGSSLSTQMQQLRLQNLKWMQQRRYTLECNWKVFVDNYLDGGYHVPYLHKGLNSVLDYARYSIEIADRFCLQSSPIVKTGTDEATGAVREGDRALYYWIYPNLMINWYDGVMDTNIVRPLGVDRTEVIFDFYFADVSPEGRVRNLASISVGEGIQNEDLAICESVQRGLKSKAYTQGRLSVRREAGEHLFHKLLCSDLRIGVGE